MAWRHIDYDYTTAYLFQKMLLWTNKNCNIYFGVKLNSDDAWIFYAGNVSHALQTGLVLVEYAAEADAQTNYLTTSRDANGKIVCVMPTITQAKYIRVYVQSGANVTIYEFIPSTYFSAHEIISGEIHITDELSESPKIRVTKNSIDRVKIGNIVATEYGITGYDSNAATIFELSNLKNQIAGWDFTATHLENGNIVLSKNGKILVRNGGDIFLESNTASGNKANLDYNSQFSIGAGTNALGIWSTAATRVGLVVGAEPITYTTSNWNYYAGSAKYIDKFRMFTRKENYIYVRESSGFPIIYSLIRQRCKTQVGSNLAKLEIECSFTATETRNIKYRLIAKKGQSSHIFEGYTDSEGVHKCFEINNTASIFVGNRDISMGHVLIHGGTTTNGGRLDIETADDSDTTINSYKIKAYKDDLEIGPDTNASLLILKAEGFIKMGKVTTKPTTPKVDAVQIWSEDIDGAAGKTGLHAIYEALATPIILAPVYIKKTTGDPTNVAETLFCINTVDNNVKIYADGGWRQLATW